MKKTISLLLALAVLLSLAACGASKGPDTPDSAIAAPTYPPMAPYPDEMDYLTSTGELKDEFYDAYDAWSESIRAQWAFAPGSTEGMDVFLPAVLRQFLAGNDGENKVFSPLNVYLALSMLAEVTAGESRDQILSLLGAEDMDTLRARARALWNANYRDDGATVSRLAASLWLDQDVDYIRATLDSLAQNYYASSYQGKMGSDALNAALRQWLSAQTGGLLDEQIEGIATQRETLLVLAAAIYFKARWSNEFSKDRTEPGIFHADSGELPCDFMRQGDARPYYWGEKFSAVFQRMENDGGMWFLLPDEGVSPEELLSDAEAMAFLLAPGGSWEKQKFLTVNLSVPRFDVASDMDLIPGLQALGITDVFDGRISDFSPLTSPADGIFLSQARHAARVTIDEEGCEAAAYTVLMAAGSAMPPDEEVDFVLDRPFLFVITGAEDAPLFAGTVHRPAA